MTRDEIRQYEYRKVYILIVPIKGTNQEEAFLGTSKEITALLRKYYRDTYYHRRLNLQDSYNYILANDYKTLYTYKGQVSW